MTDRDRLIELLKGNLPCHSNEVAFWHDEHIGALADHLIANGVTVTDNNVGCKWRPASEPPKEDGAYLTVQKACGKHLIYKVCRFATNLEKIDKDFNKRAGWYSYDGEWGYYSISEVTHWMPLPQPPKEVE